MKHSETEKRCSALFISHGGGPLPVLGDPGHAQMVETLQLIVKGIARPAAILVISAHWEEKTPRITSGATPSLIYDYYGFPEESYSLKYPCPGKPDLARKVSESFAAAGINSFLDDQRGFDHGLFIPLMIMYPEADIPCIQVSLNASLDPSTHIQMGQALSKLPDENLLILGSGFSFHNMRAFFTGPTDESRQMNAAFEDWLIETCSSRQLSEEQREEQLVDWAKAPHARYCHPREEHLLPLHVCYGVAGSACSNYYTPTILNRKSSIYLWEQIKR